MTPANRPEGEAAWDLFADVERQGLDVHVLDVDRAYLHAPQPQNGARYDKTRFAIDLAAAQVTCPAGQVVTLRGTPRVVRFEAATCNTCPQKAQCTPSDQGRTLALHPHEAQILELRRRQRTPAGRAELRQRVIVEHALARIGQIQGPKARYCGLRRNLFDLRRAAVVANLFALRDAGYAEAS